MGKRKELSPVFFGISSLNSFLTNTSSPRMVMESASHFPSHLALINPDSKVIKSGIEYELAKYINDIRSDTNCVVKAMVKRYGTSEVPYTPSYIVFTEFEENGYIFLDYIEVEFYKNHHSFFGYLLEPTEKFTSLGYHSTIEEGDILAKTASLGEKGDYCYGLTGNVAFMTHPSVSEDGYVISESFAKRAKFHSITKRIINITNDMIPVNLYGNEEVFKFLPNIGENVREDGLLCALRKRNDYFSISDLNTRSINEVDMIFDTLTYVNPHSKVLDIKVVKGNYARKSEKELSNKIFQQLDYYAEMYVNFFRNIISSFEEIMKEKKMLVGNSNVIRLTPRLHRLITDSYIRSHILPKGGTKSCYRKQNIEQYWIEVTTISELTPTYGYKMTDIHA